MAKKEKTEKTLKELRDAVKSAYVSLFELKLDMAQRKLKNTRQVFHKRKEIARLLTSIRIKELQGVENAK